MTGSHGPHLTDPHARVDAVAADLEYYRTKRLEARVMNFARRGVVTLSHLLRAAQRQSVSEGQISAPVPFDEQLRRLEDRLDALVTGIAGVMVPVRSATVAIEDMRKERGDYDPFFRISKRSYNGDLMEKLAQLERQMANCELVLEVFTEALLAAGEVTEDQLINRRNALASQGPRNGAKIVARAWVDDEFRKRLLKSGREAVRELNVPPGRLGKLGVAENTAEQHNVVVCTLCSCYPSDLLGDPPWWYRTDEYRHRIVEDPRGMLKEMFALEIDVNLSIVVRDSTSDVRWMVLPRRPEGTEGMTEEELAELVTPESLVGVAEPSQPPSRVDAS